MGNESEIDKQDTTTESSSGSDSIKIDDVDKNQNTDNKNIKNENFSLNNITKEKIIDCLKNSKQALFDLLDLKDVEDKLPEAIQKVLPENRRLVTLPIFVGFVGFLIIFLLAVFAPTADTKLSKKFTPVVRVIEVKKETITIPVYSQGVVSPGNEIQIVSLVSGPVVYVSPNFVDGGAVAENELLLEVSDRSYQQDKARVEASLARAKSVQVAKQSELRVRGTLRTNAGKAQLREVNSAVKAAEADVERVEDLISSTKFKAPFSGLIRKSDIKKGQLISSGAPVASIFSTEKFVVRVPLSDRQLSLVALPEIKIKQSKVVELGADAISEKTPSSVLTPVKISGEFGDRVFTWEGELVRSAGGRNELNRLQYVIIEIDNPYKLDSNQVGRPPLSPGVFVQAEIEGRKFENVIKLPRRSLKSNKKVWGVNTEGFLESFSVELLHKGKDFIYVSSGIESGAKILVSDLEVFANGVEVKPVISEQEESGEQKNISEPDLVEKSEESKSGKIRKEEKSESSAFTPLDVVTPDAETGK